MIFFVQCNVIILVFETLMMTSDDTSMNLLGFFFALVFIFFVGVCRSLTTCKKHKMFQFNFFLFFFFPLLGFIV